ncbi:dTDP-4-dehydrorhamnose 3,5-epimerase [Nitrosopumilus adriaticus]|uniref:dTDP-4-dehydrorhamnose 3,5-epimerase n=1 Tax=Nitrosopumilus adriaticus TaxID=1580092 RepID=A0A0D5C4T8_9ARCH|nr:dTDP-4-dehydrorhamnose 3,5-epimerase [Nitrosopumilus adriaticus]AJW71804.1 dTDP-4-deoxyrhamnose-3,5-epimerase [Nitrosopumilus adriaticus]
MVFTFKRLEIKDLILIEPTLYSDNRGFFYENFKESDFIQYGISDKFVQENFSHSVKNVIRGLHFQKKPKSQAKLVSVVKGKIFDVGVDIRKNSSTYGKWVGEILSEKNHRSLYIPEGFAHGFCVLSDEADVSYKVNNEFSPENDRGVIWNDSKINVMWPIEKPIISKKDSQLPTLDESDNNF